MMDYTQTFDDFATSVGPTDLALYAGAGIILWILFKDKLSPVQTFLMGLFNTAKETVSKPAENSTPNILDGVFGPPTKKATASSDVFFDLIASWKQTRDLAVKSGCDKAVAVADEMFPYLSPTVCSEKDKTNE